MPPAGYWDCDCGRECREPKMLPDCRAQWVETDGQQDLNTTPERNMDKAWIRKEGDSYVVRTNYAGQIARFSPERGVITRGNEASDPHASALQYLRCLPRYGVQINENLE